MTKYHIAASGKSAGKWVPCQAEHNCRIGGQHITSAALVDAVDKGDVDAYIVARDNVDNTAKIDSFFGQNTKKDARSNPPGVLKVEEGEGYAIFMDSEGKFYEKQYDRYGAGIGSRKLSGMFTGKLKKAAKEQIAEAWELHDKLELQRIAAEERDSK